MQPRGATELQMEMLEKHVSKELLDQVQICTSIPGKVPIDSDKLNILWQKNSWDQPNLQKFFSDKSRHHEYDWYIFNSHWNYEKFRMIFDIPTERSVVIKNGIEDFPIRKIYKRGTPIKLVHHCTPWRGLNVLLRAMQDVENPNITLDVYSSCKVYGSEFADNTEKDFEALYEQARKLPNVNYIGYKPNEYIKDNMHKYNMYAYPSIFEETSCISLLECMAGGLYCVTTNLGALFETGAEFPMYIPYDNNHRRLAMKFASAIDASANILHEPMIHKHIETQADYVNAYYNWNKIGTSWTRFLTGAINVKSK